MNQWSNRVLRWRGWRQTAYLMFGLVYYLERFSVPTFPRIGDGPRYVVSVLAVLFFFSVPTLLACWRPRLAARLSLIGLVPYLGACLLSLPEFIEIEGDDYWVYAFISFLLACPALVMTWLAILRLPQSERRRPRWPEVAICAVPALLVANSSMVVFEVLTRVWGAS